MSKKYNIYLIFFYKNLKIITTHKGVFTVDFCCNTVLSLAIVVAKSVGSSYTGDILSSSISESTSTIL